jgi:hypothetical protein
MSWTETPQSSNVARYAYDEASRVLTVEFKNGARYNYYDVPLSVYQGLATAASTGSYLAQHVKNVFRYARA